MRPNGREAGVSRPAAPAWVPAGATAPALGSAPGSVFGPVSVWGFTVILALGVGAAAVEAQAWISPPAADHHMHVRSAAMVGALLEAQEVVGQRVFGDDIEPLTAVDVLEALDGAGVGRAAVLSTAYMFGMPDVDFQDARARTRAENDFVSEEVARHPGRLAGFCSANPLAGYALEELRRCAGLAGIVGYKLHLANSGIDLRDPSHVERLGGVFRLAEELGMALVVHMRTRHPDYGAEDARVFVRDLLPLAPSVPVQIAHMAGWGHYDDATNAALGVFAEAIEAGEIRRDDLLFDLAAVVVPISRAATADTAMVAPVREGHDRLARRIRQIGPGRVLFATDWDAAPLPGTVAAVQLLLPLTLPELADVLDNEAPYFR